MDEIEPLLIIGILGVVGYFVWKNYPATAAVTTNSATAGAPTATLAAQLPSSTNAQIIAAGGTALVSGAAPNPAVFEARVEYLTTQTGLTPNMAAQQAQVEQGSAGYMCGYAPPGWTGTCTPA